MADNDVTCGRCEELIATLPLPDSHPLNGNLNIWQENNKNRMVDRRDGSIFHECK